ncbi:leucine-rich repeat-containing protein 15-like, partial [Coccinella septempunctata]|uniref:leucine-rich repeat-containing protein 15-like n=1 Tax=Coccinella septempunctata TaxID=41139 RepID=UPI001D082846
CQSKNITNDQTIPSSRFHLSSLSFIFLALTVLGLEDNKDNPVDVLQVKDLFIQNYKGPLTAKTFELFRDVEHLELRNNNFTTFHWDFLHALPNLKTLELAENNIKEEVDHNITGCCNKLEIISLVESGLSNVQNHTLKKIGTIKSLKQLTLNNEEVPILHKNTLVNPNLERLIITGCHLKNIENDAFSQVPELKILDLGFNNLMQIKKEYFTSLNKLRAIKLRGNLLDKLTTDMITPLPSLEVLFISYNPINELNLQGIKKIAPKLRIVEITAIYLEKIESGGVELSRYPVLRY